VRFLTEKICEYSRPPPPGGGLACVYSALWFFGGGLYRRIGLLAEAMGFFFMDDGMLLGWDGVLTRLVFVLLRSSGWLTFGIFYVPV